MVGGQLSARFLLALLAALAVFAGGLPACGDDDGNDATDTSNDVASDQTDAAQDTDPDQTIEDTAVPDTAVDTAADVPVSACTAPQDGDPVTAVYDAFVTESFSGEATVTKTGADVVVTVDTETFTGQFKPGTNCIPERFEDGLLFPLCFVTPEGYPAPAETLGAMLVTGPNNTIGIVAAQRRDVDRSCALSGHYVLEAANQVVTPDTADATIVDRMMAEFGGTLQIYELQAQTVAIIGAESPRVVNPFTVNATRDGFDSAERSVLLDDGGGTEWSVSYQATDGTFGTDSITFQLSLLVEGIGTANVGETFTVTASMSGTRR